MSHPASGDPVELRREAMATTFSVAIHHSDTVYARRAAQEALDEVERVEQRLSRYVESSDVSRINRSGVGESVRVHPDTLDCLRLAERIRRATGGAFDAAYGSKSMPSNGIRFELGTKPPEVRLATDGVHLDLGGIGKGFALDHAAAILRDWDLACYQLSASTSTHLVGAPPPDQLGWPFSIATRIAPTQLELTRRAISASGVATRGHHVIDPISGLPARRRRRVWALAPTATEADALSTAFLVMPEAAIRRFCNLRNGISAYFAAPSCPSE